MKYEVLKHEKYQGLTVGNRVLKPGAVFSDKDCEYSDKAYEMMIKEKRVKPVRESEPKKSDGK